MIARLIDWWISCPHCGHSATGKYAGRFACVRCHWVAGNE